jgi:hypothetical protein
VAAERRRSRCSGRRQAQCVEGADQTDRLRRGRAPWHTRHSGAPHFVVLVRSGSLFTT